MLYMCVKAGGVLLPWGSLLARAFTGALYPVEISAKKRGKERRVA